MNPIGDGDDADYGYCRCYVVADSAVAAVVCSDSAVVGENAGLSLNLLGW